MNYSKESKGSSKSLITQDNNKFKSFADQVKSDSEVIDLSIFCRPLSFDTFFARCKEKLNFVFIN
jgi:hypothetical protein